MPLATITVPPAVPSWTTTPPMLPRDRSLKLVSYWVRGWRYMLPDYPLTVADLTIGAGILWPQSLSSE